MNLDRPINPSQVTRRHRRIQPDRREAPPGPVLRPGGQDGAVSSWAVPWPRRPSRGPVGCAVAPRAEPWPRGPSRGPMGRAVAWGPGVGCGRRGSETRVSRRPRQRHGPPRPPCSMPDGRLWPGLQAWTGVAKRTLPCPAAGPGLLGKLRSPSHQSRGLWGEKPGGTGPPALSPSLSSLCPPRQSRRRDLQGPRDQADSSPRGARASRPPPGSVRTTDSFPPGSGTQVPETVSTSFLFLHRNPCRAW